MKIEDHLSKNTRSKLKNLSSKSKRKRKKKRRNVEKFSEKDLLELMGVGRDRYERRGGAIRKK